MSYEDQEYHRRRAEVELDSAVEAEESVCAIAHLTLARLHQEKRKALASARALDVRPNGSIPILRTDKES